MSNITVTTTCPLCKENAEIEVDTHGFIAWKGGVHIQDAMPKLSADVREQLISGTCNPCWSLMFGEE